MPKLSNDGVRLDETEDGNLTAFPISTVVSSDTDKKIIIRESELVSNQGRGVVKKEITEISAEAKKH